MPALSIGHSLCARLLLSGPGSPNQFEQSVFESLREIGTHFGFFEKHLKGLDLCKLANNNNLEKNSLDITPIDQFLSPSKI
jgi:hypothetical protein